MRLNKILHPEILMDLRGPKLQRTYYRETVKKIHFEEGDVGRFSVPSMIQLLNMSERRALMLMRRWQLDNGKVYHVAKDFLLALYGIEKEVSLDYLPKQFTGYFSFADKTIFDDQDEVEGAYVYFGPAYPTGLINQKTLNSILWITYVCPGQLGTICVEINQGDKIKDVVKRIEDDNSKNPGYGIVPPSNVKKRAMVHNVVLNLMMYLNSQEPNVQRIPSSHELSHNKARTLAAKTGLRNECELPVTFINWSYAGQRIYTAEKTWVETFPRWQPCGVGLTQIKLVWVKAHERHYDLGNPAP